MLPNKLLFVYSYACNTYTNCDVYHRLSFYGYNIIVFVPSVSPSKSFRRFYGKALISHVFTWFSHPRLQFCPAFIIAIIFKSPSFILLEQDIFCLNLFLVGLICLIKNIPIILQTYQNQDPRVIYGNLSPILNILVACYANFTYYLSSIPKRIITVSYDSFKYFSSLNPRNTRLLSLGINKSHFRSLSLNRLAVLSLHSNLDISQVDILENPECKIITFVGRLVPEKGCQYILTLLSSLTSNYILLIDSFHSSSSYQLSFDKLIDSQHLRSRIVAFSASHSQIHLIYNISDYIIVPSISTSTWSEQYGRVPIEASMCGIVPIVSDSGHLPDIPITKIIKPPRLLTQNTLFESDCSLSYTSSVLSTHSMARDLNLLINSINLDI